MLLTKVLIRSDCGECERGPGLQKCESKTRPWLPAMTRPRPSQHLRDMSSISSMAASCKALWCSDTEFQALMLSKISLQPSKHTEYSRVTDLLGKTGTAKNSRALGLGQASQENTKRQKDWNHLGDLFIASAHFYDSKPGSLRTTLSSEIPWTEYLYHSTAGSCKLKDWSRFYQQANTKHAEIIIAHSDLSLHSVPITKLSPLPFSWQGSGQIKGVGNKLQLLSMTTQVRPATDSLWLQYIFRLKKNIVKADKHTQINTGEHCSVLSFSHGVNANLFHLADKHLLWLTVAKTEHNNFALNYSAWYSLLKCRFVMFSVVVFTISDFRVGLGS